MALNRRKVFSLADARMPKVHTNTLENSFRHDIALLLDGNENIGIELGVATGIYSKRMLDSNKFKQFYGVDVYGDLHDTSEYVRALKYIGVEKPYSLLRMTFDDALHIFEDNYFDFIYVDGFAHTGEEGGRTLYSWFKKLKVGGYIGGDDYHADWPLVQWAVNEFSLNVQSDLWVTDKVEDTAYSRYPSWYLKKQTNEPLATSSIELLQIADSEKERVRKKRVWRMMEKKLVHFIRSFKMK